MNEPVLGRAADAGRDVCSLERMIRLLGLFEKPAQRWTFDQIHTRLGHSRSTLYCYLKILTDAEILSSLPGVGFTLGSPLLLFYADAPATRSYAYITSRPASACARPTSAAGFCRSSGAQRRV